MSGEGGPPPTAEEATTEPVPDLADVEAAAPEPEPAPVTVEAPNPFDALFAAIADNAPLRAAFAAGMGPQLPRGVDAFGFVTGDELEQMAIELWVGHGQLLLDLACGRGGPGLWLARRTGADLLGIDPSPEAIRQAALRVGDFLSDNHASFALGSLERTGLADGSVAAVVCVDAFQFAGDHLAAMTEIRRVLRPGGRVALTTWEAVDPAAPERNPRSIERLMASAGLTPLWVRESVGWADRERAVFEAVLAADAQIRVELLRTGHPLHAFDGFFTEAHNAPSRFAQVRRVLAVGAA